MLTGKMFLIGSLMLDSNNPERALWSQLFIVASIIISCLVSTAQRSITRFDAYVGLMTAGSPLTFYLWASAVLSLLRPMFGVCYQVKSAKAERDTPRPTLCAAALLTLLFWIALFIYTAVPECYAAFSQASCDKKSDFILRFPLFILLPLAFAFDTFYIHVHRGISAALVLPLFLTLAAWIVLILLWRTSIWTQETTFLAECTCQL